MLSIYYKYCLVFLLIFKYYIKKGQKCNGILLTTSDRKTDTSRTRIKVYERAWIPLF